MKSKTPKKPTLVKKPTVVKKRPIARLVKAKKPLEVVQDLHKQEDELKIPEQHPEWITPHRLADTSRKRRGGKGYIWVLGFLFLLIFLLAFNSFYLHSHDLPWVKNYYSWWRS